MYQQNLAAFFLRDKEEESMHHHGASLKSAAQLLHQGGADMAFAALPQQAMLEEWGRIAHAHQKRFSRVVLVGMGAATSCGAVYLPLGAKDAPCVEVIDNIDGAVLAQEFEKWDPKRTGYLIISRSGETQETLILAQELLARHQAAGGDKSSFSGMFGSPASTLGAFLTGHGLPVHTLDAKVSGRFSMFHAAGLLPALIAGVDVAGVLHGAKAVLDDASPHAPPFRGAMALAALRKGGRNIHVFLSYSDLLQPLMRWLCQLYAESLGKDGQGITPMLARGSSDQHSQMQLWCDGPQDKSFTIFSHAGHAREERLARLMDAHAQGAAAALTSCGCPLRTMTFQTLDATSMGSFVMHHMLEGCS